MRLTTETPQTLINPELATNFKKLIETLQTAARCFKSQPIGNLYRTIHCKFFENTLVDLHLIGKNKIFDVCIDRAKSCGLDVSCLQNALQMLKNLCDDSIESNKKIEDIEAYIEKNVIKIVENFCASAFPANKKQPLENSLVIANQKSDCQEASRLHTLPKELIASILSFLEPIDTPLYPKDMAALSLTCKIWHGRLIGNLRNIHLELKKLMEKDVKPLVDSIIANNYTVSGYLIDNTHSALKQCLENTSYKEYFIKYLVTRNVGGRGFAIEFVLQNGTQLIEVLNISPESWNFLSEQKKHLLIDGTKIYDISFMSRLTRDLKLPKSEKEWKLFNQLKEANLFKGFSLQSLTFLPEDRCTFFLETLQQEIALSTSLHNLHLCAKKCQIPILHVIGAERIWHFFENRYSEFHRLLITVKELNEEVALELLSILDDKLCKSIEQCATNDSICCLNALYIYLQIADPENKINSQFREKFSTQVLLHTFNRRILELIPSMLWKKVLRQYPVDGDIFRLLDPTMRITVLNKKYNLTQLKPYEVLPYLDEQHMSRLVILCHDKKTIFDLLKPSFCMKSKLPFLQAVNDLVPLNKRDISLPDFYKILEYLDKFEAPQVMMQYCSQFDISVFECHSYLQNRFGQYYMAFGPAPILTLFSMVNLLIKDLNDNTNPKTQKLQEVRSWLQSTKQFDKPLQDQILLLIRDICAMKQGYLKMFTPKSEEFFYKLCKQNHWSYIQIDEMSSMLLGELPPILNEAELKGKPLDIPALLGRISRFLTANYSADAPDILAVNDWFDDEQKPPAGQPQ